MYEYEAFLIPFRAPETYQKRLIFIHFCARASLGPGVPKMANVENPDPLYSGDQLKFSTWGKMTTLHLRATLTF